MLSIYTEVLIDCPPEQVWQVLMDFDNYPNWNSFIKRIELKNRKGNDTLQLNTQLFITLNQKADKTMSFSSKVIRYEPNKSFHWLGKLWIKGVFDGKHQFDLIPTGDDAKSTLFIHQESFTGLLVPLFKRSLNNNTKMRFKEMNLALKQYCERG